MPIAESESDQDSHQTESNETPIPNEKTAQVSLTQKRTVFRKFN